MRVLSTCLLFLTAVAAQAAPEPVPFGMRLRALPAENRDINAPVVVREAPENEASVVLRRADGILQIWYIARPAGQELHSIASSDNGRTWSAATCELKLPGTAYHGVQVLVDDAGELQAAFHIYRGDGRRPGVDRNLDVWHCRTSGQGKTWGKPQRIYEGYVGSLRGFTQLRNGRLVLPVAIAIPERLQAPPAGQPDLGWHDVVVFTSDNRGQTWQQSPARLQVTLTGPSTTRYGAVEPHVRQLKDGRVWLLIRDRCGRLYESYSADGADWSAPKRTRFISSDSPATTVRLDDGRLVLFWCANQRWDDPRSYALGGREALHAAISADEGRTWQGFREVLHEPAGPPPRGDRGAAYPSAAPTRDGKLLLVSGQGAGRKAIVLLDPDWLTQTHAADDFRRGLEQWTIHGAAGVQVIDHKLDIRRVDAPMPAAAVWNFPAGTRGRLRVRLRPRDGFKSGRLALTDHFSIAGDAKADDHAVLSLPLDDALLKPGQTHEIVITWTGDGGEAQIDGQKPVALKSQRAAATGLNYLRLAAADAAGFQVESVHVDVTPPGQAFALPKPIALTKIPGRETGGAVLDLGDAGAFDAAWVGCPSVHHDGAIYRMWYSSSFDSKMGRGGIGLATSRDGIHWQRQHEGKPVLEAGPAGSFDDGQVMGPEVHVDKMGYRMWYTGMARTWHDSGFGHYRIGLATSRDGIHWQRANGGQPVLDLGPAGEADHVQAATPTIVRDGSGFRMWYAAWSPQHGHSICSASSPDGIRWQRDNQGKPVAGLRPEAFAPAVIRQGEGYFLVYMALKAAPGLYAAESSDGRNWHTLNHGDPILLPGPADTFDAALPGHPFLLNAGQRQLLWYTGYRRHAGKLQLRIGLAETRRE